MEYLMEILLVLIALLGGFLGNSVRTSFQSMAKSLCVIKSDIVEIKVSVATVKTEHKETRRRVHDLEEIREMRIRGKG